MAISDANKQPIYTLGGDNSTDSGTTMTQAFTAASPDYTGIDADYKLCFTAGANGSYVQRIRFKAAGTNVATVARIFINNGSTNATLTNNAFYGEVSLPATTASSTVATVEVDYPMNLALTPAFRIYVGIATAVAGGWSAFVVAGEY